MAGPSYLTLVNAVLKRLNEVLLTSSTFATVTGFHDHIKDCVNNSIYDINNQDFEWPFNYAAGSQVLVGSTTGTGTTAYALPATYSTIDWESFYLSRNDALTIPVKAKKLPYLDYDDWLQNYKPKDDNIVSGNGNAAPARVTKDYTDRIIVTPPPNQNYTITYNYWTIPTALSLYTDTTTVPTQFQRVIEDGAMFYAYMFRENFESAGIVHKKFRDGIETMRKMVVNQKKYARAV